MMLVIRGKEGAGPVASGVNGLETVRIGRMVLHGLELRLAERVVIGSMRTAVAFGDPQVYQQLAQGLAFHRRTVVSVKGELVGLNAVFMGGFIDKLPSQVAALLFGNHPADHIATENVQDSVEPVVLPFVRATKGRDVP